MNELKVASLFELEKVLKGSSNKLFYSKSEADKVIADLNKEIARLDDVDTENRVAKRALWLTRVARAHAEWSHWATIWFCDTTIKLNINKSSIIQVPYCCTIKRNAAIWRNMWSEVERKCRAKAELESVQATAYARDPREGRR